MSATRGGDLTKEQAANRLAAHVETVTGAIDAQAEVAG
jgi:hypothetical protein